MPSPSRPLPQIAIVGAGAAGTLMAIQLLEQSPADHPASIVLIDPTEQWGRGVAYGTTDPAHLMNVPASRLGAFPDRPGHFLAWHRRRNGATPAYSFLPRQVYGEYLAETLRTSVALHGGTVHHRRARATAVRRTGDWLRVTTDDGQDLTADALVVATGLPSATSDWAPTTLQASRRFVADPWAPGAISRILDDPGRGDVLLVGSGLTTIDVALSLRHTGRRLHVVSRSGRLPAAHGEHPVTPAIPDVSDWGRSLRGIRQHARAHISTGFRMYGDWRPAVDGLRHQVTELWTRLSPADRAAFIAEDAGTWNAHRHRMPPSSAYAVRELRDADRLTLARAQVKGAAERPDVLDVELSDGSRREVAWVVNCTGPRTDVRRLGNPLIEDLLREDRATGPLAGVDPTGLGLTTRDGLLIPPTGEPAAPIWTLGALRRGELWESTAIVDIRAQAAGIATQVLLREGVHIAHSA
ncbi:FAD/NAD(P)-binding protein [Nocardioides montaniterrae]